MQQTPSSRTKTLALQISVFVIVTCGLIYEMLAGTVVSYLLGDSVTQSRPSSAPTCSRWASARTCRATFAAS